MLLLYNNVVELNEWDRLLVKRSSHQLQEEDDGTVHTYVVGVEPVWAEEDHDTNRLGFIIIIAKHESGGMSSSERITRYNMAVRLFECDATNTPNWSSVPKRNRLYNRGD